MTDRFYPVGQPSADDVWKTSYEVQNDMRAFERSPYPPGTSIHLPGARDAFGFGTPGPVASRLSNSGFALSEDVGLDNPREHHAVPRAQIADEHDIFHKHDVPEMMRYMNRSRQGTGSQMMMSSPKSAMAKSSSLPTIGAKRPAPPKLAEAKEPIQKFDDEKYSYFVPRNLQKEGRERLQINKGLSKLHKDNKFVFSSGDGTGFRSQASGSDWWPQGSYDRHLPTQYRSVHVPPTSHR